MPAELEMLIAEGLSKRYRRNYGVERRLDALASPLLEPFDLLGCIPVR
jgi:hypothetical protein